ncbi:MAG TPA: nuclear transport factor 2 family protein [Saprospiraceae bacterium]|nr:nuclear transport factor 2 family protein [Saprospiraceae bacterium]
MKNIVFLLLSTLTLTSCNNKTKNNMTTTDNEKLVKQYFEHFNNHEWTKMANMYSENSEFKDPSLGQGIVKQTRQQIIDKYSELNKVFPDLHDEVIQTYPSGDKHIIVEFISTGTAPDNSKFELPICTIMTIENGIITKDFTYYDNFEEENREE